MRRALRVSLVHRELRRAAEAAPGQPLAARRCNALARLQPARRHTPSAKAAIGGPGGSCRPRDHRARSGAAACAATRLGIDADFAHQPAASACRRRSGCAGRCRAQAIDARTSRGAAAGLLGHLVERDRMTGAHALDGRGRLAQPAPITASVPGI